MTRHIIHKYVGPGGFNRIKHTKAMMEQRIELTEEFGEHTGSGNFPSAPIVSSFTIETSDNPKAIDSLRKEVAPFVGSTLAQTCSDRVIVLYDGTEDTKTIEASQPERTPTSQFRASLPA